MWIVANHPDSTLIRLLGCILKSYSFQPGCAGCGCGARGAGGLAHICEAMSSWHRDPEPSPPGDIRCSNHDCKFVHGVYAIAPGLPELIGGIKTTHLLRCYTTLNRVWPLWQTTIFRIWTDHLSKARGRIFSVQMAEGLFLDTSQAWVLGCHQCGGGGLHRSRWIVLVLVRIHRGGTLGTYQPPWVDDG